MFNKNWEKKWEQFSMDFLHKIRLKEEEKWLEDFLHVAILLTNVSFSAIVGFIFDWKIKVTDYKEKNIEKILFNAKQGDAENTLKYLLSDFFAYFYELPLLEAMLASKEITPLEMEHMALSALRFSKNEKDNYNLLKSKKDSTTHTVGLLATLGLGKDAYNEGLVDGIEFIKHEFYQKLISSFTKTFS